MNKIIFRASNHGCFCSYSMPTGVKPKAIKIRKNKVLFRNSNHGYQLCSTPTGCLNQLKFVKIKSSLETPTMAISSYSTPTGCLNQLKFVKIKFSLENSNHGYYSYHSTTTECLNQLKIRKNPMKVFLR